MVSSARLRRESASPTGADARRWHAPGSVKVRTISTNGKFIRSRASQPDHAEHALRLAIGEGEAVSFLNPLLDCLSQIVAADPRGK